MNNAISIVFDKINTTDDDIPMEINDTLSSKILDVSDAKNYSMMISKIDIPTSQIIQLYFSDRSKYKIVNQYYNHVSHQYTTFETQLPNDLSHGIRYYTKEMALEMINRCHSKNYFDYLDSLVSDSNSSNIFLVSGTFSNTNQLSTAFNPTTSYLKFAGFKVRVTGFTKNSGSDNQIVKLKFRPQSGEDLILYSGTLGYLAEFGSGYDINDFSFRDWDNSTQASAKLYGIKSYEHYNKLKDAQTNGNCHIILEGSSTYSVNLNLIVSLYFSDQNYIPTLPTFISNTNDQLKLNVQGIYLMQNNKVAYSKTLYNSLPFTYVSKKVNDLVFLSYDTTILPKTTLELLDNYIFFQIQANLNALMNIKEVSLRSSTFSSVGEAIISNSKAVVNTNTLAEFVINKDLDIGQHLLFTVTERSWRLLDISSLLTSMNTINFSIFTTYENGESQQCYLAPSEIMSIRLSFIKGY